MFSLFVIYPNNLLTISSSIFYAQCLIPPISLSDSVDLNKKQKKIGCGSESLVGLLLPIMVLTGKRLLRGNLYDWIRQWWNCCMDWWKERQDVLSQRLLQFFRLGSTRSCGDNCHTLDPPLLLRHSHRLTHRQAKDIANTSTPIIKEGTRMSFSPARPSHPEDDLFSSPHSPRCPHLSPFTAKYTTTILWHASILTPSSMSKVKSSIFCSASTTTIRFSFPDGDLSVVVEKGSNTWKKIEQIARQVSSLGVGIDDIALSPKIGITLSMAVVPKIRATITLHYPRRRNEKHFFKSKSCR